MHERDAATEKSRGSAAERRRWARADADLPITLFLSGTRCEARIRDLSRAGVCFFLDRPIPLMTVLQLSLPLRTKSGVRELTGQGAVVRCARISKAIEHYEIALFLHEMNESDRELIEDFVRGRLGGNTATASSSV